MAIHAHNMGARDRATLLSDPVSPVGQILSRFDREQLHAFVTIAIDLLDAAAPDPDLEPEDDRCAAGDDQMVAGAVAGLNAWERRYDLIGDDADAECGRRPIQHRIDQTHALLPPLDPEYDRGRSEFDT